MSTEESSVDRACARLRAVSDQSWADRIARGAHESWAEAVMPIRTLAEAEPITVEVIQGAQAGVNRLMEIVHAWAAPAVVDQLTEDVQAAADAVTEICAIADPTVPQLPAVPPRTMGAEFETVGITIRMRADLRARIDAECALLQVPGQKNVDRTRVLHAGAMMVVERLEEARRARDTAQTKALRAYLFRY